MCAASPLHVYCQSQPLLFQFLLAELFRVDEDIKQIHSFRSTIKQTLAKEAPPSEIKELLTGLHVVIATTTGTAGAHEEHFPWYALRGSLNKLKHYGRLYAQLAIEGKKETSALNICIHQAFHTALQIKEETLALRHGFDHSSDVQLSDYTPLFLLLDKIILRFEKSLCILVPLIVSYKENENVLYFLLTEEKKINALFHEGFFIELLNKMCSSGIAKAQNTLLNNYSKRGFHHIVSSISKKLDQLIGAK